MLTELGLCGACDIGDEREQRGRIVGLCDVAIEAGDPGEDAIGSLDPSGDSDQLRAISAITTRRLLRDLVPTAIEQPDINQTDVGADRMEEAPELFRRSRTLADVAFRAPQLANRAKAVGLSFGSP